MPEAHLMQEVYRLFKNAQKESVRIDRSTGEITFSVERLSENACPSVEFEIAEANKLFGTDWSITLCGLSPTADSLLHTVTVKAVTLPT